jgi:hypothetical protein
MNNPKEKNMVEQIMISQGIPEVHCCQSLRVSKKGKNVPKRIK